MAGDVLLRKFHYADINVDTPSLGIFFCIFIKEKRQKKNLF